MLRTFTNNNTRSLLAVLFSLPFVYLVSVPYTVTRLAGQPILVYGLSRWFLLLTRFLMPLTFLLGIHKEQVHVMGARLFVVELALLRSFTVTELLSFYIVFEMVLMPMFLLILVYGSRRRRIRACYQFFLYTVAFSLFLLVACVWLHATYGTTDWRVLMEANMNLTGLQEGLLFTALFLRLAVKVPMMPLHLWLPEAHTEASTEGSVILAGVLLKLGTYGILRFLLPLYPVARTMRAPAVMTLSAIRVVRAAMTCIRQADLKKMIAYSSVSHMGLVTLGLFTGNVSRQMGRTYMMLTHGIVSPALFLRVGMLYERYGTRTLDVYGGMTTRMPLFRVVWGLAVFSNMAIPGTASFPAEFLILLGSFQEAKFATFLRSFGIVLTAAYCIRLYTMVLGGVLKPHMTGVADLTRKEAFVCIWYVGLMILAGVRPTSVLRSLEHVIYM